MERGETSTEVSPSSKKQLRWQLLVLALLICDTAAGLASRLAGSLALAASAVLCAVAQVTSFDRLDMFHSFILHLEIYGISLAQPTSCVNHIFYTKWQISFCLVRADAGSARKAAWQGAQETDCSKKKVIA